jgi:hypothetical protein
MATSFSERAEKERTDVEKGVDRGVYVYKEKGKVIV